MLILTASEFETKISANFFQNPKVSRTHKQNAKKTQARKDQRVVFYCTEILSAYP